MQPLVIIRLATKGSKTVAKVQVTCTVEIAPQIRVKTQFLVVPIKEYQAILGMPFLQQHEVKLDTANGTAIFGKHHDYAIRCNDAQSAAILVTAAAGTNEETVTLPDFTKEFPNVYPEREPQALPPIREGCNHKHQQKIRGSSIASQSNGSYGSYGCFLHLPKLPGQDGLLPEATSQYPSASGSNQRVGNPLF
jgi:hypothetical protein